MGKSRLYVSTPLPAWAKQIQALRRKLHFTQAEFGEKRNYSSMTVSRWERGLQKPPTECLIVMGKIAGPRWGWFFWNIAGINPRDARAMLRKRR